MIQLINILEHFFLRNVKTKLVGLVFSSNQNYDLKKLGNGKGVRHLTVRNTGEVNIIIQDIFEVIPPGQAFTINSPLLVTNEKFALKFDNESASENKQGVIRYLVDQEN
jgi:hypothetical protein